MATVLVTGSTSGLGRYLALELARAGHTVVAHGRDAHRTAQLVARIDQAGGTTAAVVADLSSLADVRALGLRVGEAHPRLDVLVNNAGLGFGPPGAGRETGADGHELRLTVNYLAPVLLTRTLLPVLRAAGPSRVVNVGSAGQEPVDLGDLDLVRGYDGRTAYRRSKFALAAHTFTLAEELSGGPVTANVVHPATFMDTAMVREGGIAPLSSVHDGVAGVLELAVGGAGGAYNGAYFEGTEEGRAHPSAYDPRLRAELAAATEGMLRDFL
ncbi:SDR family NAD(P)-dependent oxidoreductase [Streptomyces sp. NPDC058045]|uniref:SDR family NAD(P)-dependent oxidoreductase n=1 Tax=Streptomyces sp. NPDC058045 TaxID=3346311 RepID=UPI0036E2C2B4